MSSGQPIMGINSGSIFLGNVWWNTSGTKKFMNFNNLADWAKKTGQEMLNGHFTGMQADPKFVGPLVTGITDPYELDKLYGFTLQPDSPLRNKGLDLRSIPGMVRPVRDFFGNQVPMGAAAEPGIYEMK